MEKRKVILLILVALGIAVSGYLTYIKLSNNELACGLGQCGAVQSSEYSEMFGVPVALFGVGFYVLLGILILTRLDKWVQLWGVWGLIFSSYLTIIELYVIKAICIWCVISFVIIILINLLLPKTAQNDLSSS